MLLNARLPESYWFDALQHAVHIHNVTPTRALKNLTPEEAWSSNKPDISSLCVFGSRVFVHIPDKQCSKLGAKSLECTLLGYMPQRNAYRLVHCPLKQFLELHNIVFDEGGQAPVERVIFEPNAAAANPDPPKTTPTPSHPKRTIRTPTRDDDDCYTVTSYGPQKQADEHASVAQSDIASNPKTYAEAMSHPDTAQWEMACADKMRTFENMGIYKIVPHPEGRKVVGSKWVFRIKHRPNGEIQKYKARIVAQGFMQIEGVNYNETFAPVTKLSSIRAILAIGAELNLEVHQMDIKSAYLNADLNKEISMVPPPGFDIPEGMVLCLNKAVYGTKQGGRMWYIDIHTMLEEMGYTHLECDHAVFICVRDSILSIITLYIDDISMAGNLTTISTDKEELKEKYQMTDLGKMSWILGMHVTCNRNKGTITLSQQQYIEDVLKWFGVSNVRPISTPALANEHLIKLDSPEIDIKSYQCAIGTLMYPMLGTHPDLAYAVGALGRHAANPGPNHQCALDRVFKYLRATSDCGLVFQQGAENGLTLMGFVDTNWASDVNDRRSTSGYIFMLAGCAISWSSKKQMSVTLSSTEAEYIAGAHAVKELIWLRQLLTGLGLEINSPTLLHMDNQLAIAIAKNPAFHKRTKHIEVRYHFLKSKVESKEIELAYVPTMDQTADTMTKGLPREKHERFVGWMGLCHLG
jgi:hypothetical protein